MNSPAYGYLLLAFLAFALGHAVYVYGRRGLGSGLAAARAKALEALGAGMVIMDGRGRLSSANREARLLLGIGEAPPLLVHSALREVPELAALLTAGQGGADFTMGKDGSRRRIEARAFPFGRSGKGTVLIIRDVTENAVLLEELSALASQDALTGAFNRRRFDELGSRDIELSRRSSISVGVLMLDIDLFKRVNDEHGHPVGDEVLKALSSACKDALRSSDVLARYGGEEFAVLLPGSGREESVAVAERLRARVGALEVPSEGASVSVTVSVGAYSAVPGPGDTLDLFLRRADEALYRSKALGRDRVSFWSPISKEDK
jgi:diguanylate cyclase (GGDEF)-like protein